MTATTAKFDLSGRSALVTGGTSGIGLAIAEAMAEAGASVTLTGTTTDKAERVAKELRDAGHEARGVKLDAADYQQVKAAIDGHVEAFGALHACFANAGVDSGRGYWDPVTGSRLPEGEIENFDLALWDRVLAVNLTGAMYTMREAARVMKAGGIKGSIIATTSVASTTLYPIIGTSYMVAKAGLRQLVRSLALELAESGIRVNAIAPGPTVTNIGGGAMAMPEVRALWARDIPLQRVGETHEIQPLALYLASDASSYVTGAEINIDGGSQLGKLG